MITGGLFSEIRLDYIELDGKPVGKCVRSGAARTHRQTDNRKTYCLRPTYLDGRGQINLSLFFLVVVAAALLYVALRLWRNYAVSQKNKTHGAHNFPKC